MIGIENIGSYVPEGRISNFDRKEQFEINDQFITEKLGVKHVSRKSAQEETSDLCVRAAEALQEKVKDALTDVDCLVVCTQNPDGHGIPHTSAIVHGKLGVAEGCACFDISLGCSGYVYSVSIVKAFMEANGLKKGLLFTADPYSKVVNSQDKNTTLLFGDAATVTLLKESGNSNGTWSPKAFSFASKGKDHGALHNREKHLNMNGRAVFNFSITEVPAQINRLLEKEHLAYDDIDLFLFHQGSKYMVDQLCERMKLPSEKVPINLEDQGNTVSSSIPLLLEGYLDRKDTKNIVMSGFGVGLSWASCLLSR